MSNRFDHDSDDGGLPPDTRLESVEALRQAHRAALRTPTGKEQAPVSAAQPFRPVRRPPVALLCVLDDDGEDGEWLRIRVPRFLIGRTEGDLVLPHDDMISSRHLEISRRPEGQGHRWVLTDLGSTNGTFVRVTAALLRNGQELLLGGRRYQFQAQAGEAPSPPVQRGTQAWPAAAGAAAQAWLVELRPSGEGQRNPLARHEQWLGRDARQCALAINDPLLDPRHARIFHDDRGRWHLEGAGTVNGVWLRVRRVPVDGLCQFQMGEQRFLFKVSG